MRLGAAFIAVLAALALASPARADVFTVTNGSSDTPTGCAGTTCPSLRAAIAAAEITRPADTINVPAGTININNDLAVGSDMTIVGTSARTNIIDGGAKYRGLRVAAGATVSLSHFTIRNGAAGQAGSNDGGGVLNQGSLVLDSVHITGSQAARGGGVANLQNGITQIAHSLIDGNTATTTGGGLVNVGNTETQPITGIALTDSTVFNNTAAAGGTGGIAAVNLGGILSVVRSTVADNVGGTGAAAGGISSTAAGRTSIAGSILARNKIGTATVNCNAVKPTDAGANVEDNDTCGFNFTGNPQLDTKLASAGGDVDVLPISGASPAVDRLAVGSNCAAGTLDQRGLYRPQGTACDSGAYELDVPATYTITSGPNGTTITTDSVQFDFSSTDPSADPVCQLTGPGQSAGFVTCYKSNAALYTGLGNGSYTFSVRDSAFPSGPVASRLFTVAALDTTITGGPNGPTNDTTPTFTFTGAGGAVSFQCRVDGAQFAACSTPFTTVPLAQGSHTFEVRAQSAAGGVDNTPASRSFTVDTTPPDTNITGGPTGTVASTSATFTYTATEAGSTFQCALDGAAFAACPAGYTGLAQGAHTFQVRATDGVGNVDASPATQSWTVDTVAPNTTINSGPSGNVSSTSATFTFSSTEAGSTFQCALDGAAFAACPAGYTGLAQGAHTFQVRATDAVGNVDASPATQSWTVDTVAPNTTINSGPTGAVASTSATFTFSSTEAGSTFQCALDGAAFAACPAGYTGLAQGAHTFQVRATDAVGNVDASPATQSWTVDTVAPNTTINSGPTGAVASTSATFTFSSTEAGSTFQCALDGAAFAACPAGYTGLAQGAHTFQVRAIDAAGNTDASPATQSWTVDTVAPNTDITGGPTGSVSSTSATFTYTSTEAGSTFQCSLDSAAFAACPAGYTGLAQGSHTFAVRATDGVGNIDASPATRTWTVDTVAPNTDITGGPTGTVASTSAAFTYTSTEAGSTFQCSLDSAAFAACPASYTGLAQGAHTFQVRAVDAAGNTDATPASRGWTVDTAAPDTTITVGADNLGNDPTPSFSFTSSEAGSTFQCRIDGAQFASCTSPFTSAPLSDGSHTFNVRATDAVGNTDATPAAQTFVIDTTTPNTDVTSSPGAATNDTTPSFSFTGTGGAASFQCRVDGTAYAACTSPFTAGPLTAGQHTVDIRALNAAGTPDPSPASVVFVVDLTAPNTSLTPIATPTNDATPSFMFSANEAGATFECRVDGGAFTSCDSPFTTATLGAGTHTFDVRATDPAGNVDPTPASQTFTLDTGAPSTTISAGPSGATNDATPTFTFVSDEPGSTFECQIDAAAFVDCTSPFTSPQLTDGVHTFEVRATDVAGNLDATPASRAFTVDTTPPAAPAVVSGPDGPTTDSSPAFSFSAADAVSTACKLDGPGPVTGEFGACTSPKTFGALAPGDYVFSVRSVDAAGNAQTTQRAFTVTVPQQATPAPTPTPSVTPTGTPTPTPVANQSVDITPVSGTVLIKLPGSKVFVKLSPSLIKNGAEVDARKGVVEITRSDGGVAKFYDGIFKLSHSGGFTVLTLTEKLTGCPKPKKSSASAAAKKPKTRKLWGDGKGKFRTKGQYSAATVRGTKWLVTDTCTTTVTKVATGVVEVQDFAKKKKVLIKKGKSYTARPKKK
ncbi:Ig-like domain-containing protein [Solirubrobacter ginsenosidimutans]|uniref:Ig-like domain-containing protein n=1 Tax=Solirubrobacter ginsenosidimutans TaxID=490573 RepID=A0A9X3MXR5_9ACTN|nr:Ig-like domain-containing protein [Solirubrobacter ginsenosidimutans]MDA0164689.1 Ig-like domain-containing protein [Solirubrobacter ginsenosidimutans]